MTIEITLVCKLIVQILLVDLCCAVRLGMLLSKSICANKSVHVDLCWAVAVSITEHTESKYIAKFGILYNNPKVGLLAADE